MCGGVLHCVLSEHVWGVHYGVCVCVCMRVCVSAL